MQHGQVLELTTRRPDGQPLWAYRNRVDGRGSNRPHPAASPAARKSRPRETAIGRARRRTSRSSLTLSALVQEYLLQHDARPETTVKLRWLLVKSVAVFRQPTRRSRHRRLARDLAPGYRFEPTQALRQVLARGVDWHLIDGNPAKVGVDNQLPSRREMLPFDDPHLEAVAEPLGAIHRPMVRFAAATGLRPGQLIGLERHDVDLDVRLIHVRRTFRANRLETTNDRHAARRAAATLGTRRGAEPRRPLRLVYDRR